MDRSETRAVWYQHYCLFYYYKIFYHHDFNELLKRTDHIMLCKMEYLMLYIHYIKASFASQYIIFPKK